MKQMERHVTLIAEVNNVQITLVGVMQDSVSERRIALRNIAIPTDEGSLRQEAQRIRTLEAAYADAKARLGKTFEDALTTPEENTAVQVMVEAHRLGLANRIEATKNLLMNKAAPLRSAWPDALLKCPPSSRNASDHGGGMGRVLILVPVRHTASPRRCRRLFAIPSLTLAQTR